MHAELHRNVLVALLRFLLRVMEYESRNGCNSRFLAQVFAPYVFRPTEILLADQEIPELERIQRLVECLLLYSASLFEELLPENRRVGLSQLAERVVARRRRQNPNVGGDDMDHRDSSSDDEDHQPGMQLQLDHVLEGDRPTASQQQQQDHEAVPSAELQEEHKQQHQFQPDLGYQVPQAYLDQPGVGADEHRSPEARHQPSAPMLYSEDEDIDGHADSLELGPEVQDGAQSEVEDVAPSDDEDDEEKGQEPGGDGSTAHSFPKSHEGAVGMDLRPVGGYEHVPGQVLYDEQQQQHFNGLGNPSQVGLGYADVYPQLSANEYDHQEQRIPSAPFAPQQEEGSDYDSDHR